MYMLKEKWEALCAFEDFKRLVENGSGHKLKTLRIDRGDEFLFQNFLNFCKGEGIKSQFSAMYTLKQNEVVQRRNHTILNIARSLLKRMQVPVIF